MPPNQVPPGSRRSGQNIEIPNPVASADPVAWRAAARQIGDTAPILRVRWRDAYLCTDAAASTLVPESQFVLCI